MERVGKHSSTLTLVALDGDTRRCLGLQVTTLLTDGIGMANGVQFRHDRDELLVVELTRSQVVWVGLVGEVGLVRLGW